MHKVEYLKRSMFSDWDDVTWILERKQILKTNREGEREGERDACSIVIYNAHLVAIFERHRIKKKLSCSEYYSIVVIGLWV